MVVLLLALLSACADAPVVPDAPSSHRAGVSDPMVAPTPSGPPETDFTGLNEPVGSVTRSATGHRRAWSRRVHGALSTELVVEEAGQEHIVVSEGNPDRPVLTHDGQWLAYVSAESGWASVYVMPFDGGQPVQLTNRGLLPHKGSGMPPGWTPPPLADSLAFDGDALVWESPAGSHKVMWR